MRKRRAVIYDDDLVIKDMLNQYFSDRGYEVLTFKEPVVCPIEEDSVTCSNLNACADIIVTDFMMPIMNGIELLKAQTKRGCKLTIKNKALTSGFDVEDIGVPDLHELGCAFFRKPFNFDEMSAWLSERELQMDLSRPLGIRRKEKRYESDEEVTYLISVNNENLEGIALNMSTSGLCIKTKAPLRQEQSLIVHFGQADLSRVALVRWLRELDSGLYMAGLNFT
jgi:DNA-binding NtrC family response regulator